jgi:rod shape determining protein RodA
MGASHATFIVKRMDWLFLAVVLALVATGVAFIYSASFRNEDSPLSALTQRQLLWALAGLAIFVLALLTDYHRAGDVAWVFYGVCLVLLVLVLVMGVKIYGAHRWLNLFGVQLQPSEFAKLATLIVVARYLSEPSRDPADPRTLLAVLGLVLAPFVLILRQPDLGTATMLVPVTFVLLYVAGVPVRYLLVLAALGAIAAVPGWFFLNDYQRERVLVFLDPGRDPLGTGWNSIQSSIAVGSGGLLGKGYMMGTQNILGFLPRTVAPSDFIFSVIAEETGFVGSLVLLTLFAALIGGCMRAALASRDKFGRLLAVGVITLLFGHIFVNIAMTVGLMPVKGLPLPLISYGGSFMVCTLAGLGLVQSVYARRFRR